MLSDLFPFLARPILPVDFERKVFRVVTKHVSDKDAFRDEIAGIENLKTIPIEDPKRPKAAAELYLLLERNISEEQAKGRVPKEALREEIANRCRPERAQGNFALMFIPHYERQIVLFKRFATMIFDRAKELMGSQAYAAFVGSLAQDPVLADGIKNNAIAWDRIERAGRDYTLPVRRDMLQKFLERALRSLAKKMTEEIGELRTGIMFDEIYHHFKEPIAFVEDVAKVLVVVPENFLTEERIALMGKAELEAKLREKSRVLETTLAEVQGEKLKLSELSREELEKKVQERTAELVTALRAAEEARKNLEEFSSLATHELRTPIAAMKGYINLVLNDKDTGAKLDQDQKKYLLQATHANERLLTLVNAMLDVSRIELGTLAIEPSPLSLLMATDEVLMELAAKIKEHEQTIVKHFDASLPSINMDPSLTHAILINIISNAVKYTPDKGAITIAIKKHESEAILTVSDTGFGIPKAQQPRIFEKLFRADNARAKISEGTGLGLYLVKSILDETGGKISFESEENKGTTFTVTIPLSGMKRREGMKGLS